MLTQSSLNNCVMTWNTLAIQGMSEFHKMVTCVTWNFMKGQGYINGCVVTRKSDDNLRPGSLPASGWNTSEMTCTCNFTWHRPEMQVKSPTTSLFSWEGGIFCLQRSSKTPDEKLVLLVGWSRYPDENWRAHYSQLVLYSLKEKVHMGSKQKQRMFSLILRLVALADIQVS